MLRLPVRVQPILSISDTSVLEHLAEMANKIVQVRQASMAVANTATAAAQVEELTGELSALRSRFDRFSSKHSRGPDRHRRRSKTGPVPRMCFYHDNFGKEAKKYRPQCSSTSQQGNKSSHY